MQREEPSCLCLAGHQLSVRFAFGRYNRKGFFGKDMPHLQPAFVGWSCSVYVCMYVCIYVCAYACLLACLFVWCVCGIPVAKEVAFADSFVYERMQGAASLPSELRPTKTSDGKCENVPAEYTQISSEPRNPDELVCGGCFIVSSVATLYST